MAQYSTRFVLNCALKQIYCCVINWLEENGSIVHYWTTLYELQLLLNIEKWTRIIVTFDGIEKGWGIPGRGLLKGTIPAFFWRDWEIPEGLQWDWSCPDRNSNRPPLRYNSKTLSVGPASSISRRGRERSTIIMRRRKRGVGRNKFSALCHFAVL
jgi:hypothetical protein